MKKMLCGSFAVIMLIATSSAFAVVDNNSLTTKGYVDDGLRAVYTTATGAQNTANTAIQAIGSVASGGNAGTGLAGKVETLEGIVGNANSGLQQDVSDLQDTVGEAGNGTAGSGTGLTGRVEDLELQMQNVPSALQGENGVTISSGKASITGLSSTTGSDNKMYILKNNTATELSVATTWDSSVLTTQP